MVLDVSHYKPSSIKLWQGRKDSLPKERLFQRVKIVDPRTTPLECSPNHLMIIGFCSDEGIYRNEGRPGACQGPLILRQQLAKLPHHNNKELIDLGNIYCENQQLESAQQELAKLVSYCQQQQCKTLVLGGGHEVAWGHFQGLTEKFPKLGIINFDAHFDLRPLLNKQLGTSGTPFYQIAQYCESKKLSFDYCCIGIQHHANTKSLFNTAERLKVNYITAEQIFTASVAWQTAFLNDFLLKHEAIYLSICLDVFAESFAPGVSAPQALGLTPWQVLPLLKFILQTGKVVSVEIAELSPPLDENQKTARLAAMIIAEILEL